MDAVSAKMKSRLPISSAVAPKTVSLATHNAPNPELHHTETIGMRRKQKKSPNRRRCLAGCRKLPKGAFGLNYLVRRNTFVCMLFSFFFSVGATA
jgi:hypothetical protein